MDVFFWKLTHSERVFIMCGHQDESLLARVSQLTPLLPLSQVRASKTPPHRTVQ